MIKPEHIVEMFRQFGGGVPGDLAGTTHVTVMDCSAWIVPMVEEFLNLPLPAQV